MVVVSLVGLCGFVALGVDVGMMTVAKTDAQNAADAAALAGARSIDGSDSPNINQATTNARGAAAKNRIIAAELATTDTTVLHGSYHYDLGTQTFVPQFPPVAPDTYNLTRATVTRRCATGFGSVVGFDHFDITAKATAAHRPRDVTIVLDFSGSMNDESDLWLSQAYFADVDNTPNNTDSVYPRFGHYSATSSATIQSTSSDSRVGKCNVTQAVLGVPALVDNFYQSGRGVSPAVKAFTSVPYAANNDYYATSQPGDKYLKDSNNTTSSAYSKTVSGVVGATTRAWKFELDGYARYSGASGDSEPSGTDYSATPFVGSTRGPGYWGKTFFLWPPDPRSGAYTNSAAHRNLVQQYLIEFDKDTLGTDVNWDTNNDSVIDTGFTQAKAIFQNWPYASASALNTHLVSNVGLSSSSTTYKRIMRLHNRPTNDWRKVFFNTNDNTVLWDSTGTWRTPSGYYTINYAAILNWIKNSGPNPFPSQLRAGRILYYSQIPNDVPASAYTHTNANSAITDPDQRFWKEYIDYVLGVWRAPNGTISPPQDEACSYGPDFTWSSATISAPPSLASPYSSYRYMSYTDSPKRPRHRMWFGPMTMMQFLIDTKLQPGTATDISMYPMKLGIAGALEDIKNNHPNDLVSLILFNRPPFANDAAGLGQFSQPLFSLSRSYSAMQSALWFPPNSTSADVRLWDANGLQTPRAADDFTSNTTTVHGLMLAYNQLSGSSTVRAQAVGGLGRKGAQRLVILETDGMANVGSTPAQGFYSGGVGNSYYRILPGDTVNSATYNQNALLQVVQNICNKADGTAGTPVSSPPYSNQGYPGFATTRKPVIIHTIAFGTIFEPTTTGATKTSAVSLLDWISKIGGTTFPSSASDATNGYKWCIGTLDERKNKLRQAFSKIMDDGVSVTLVE
jgi:hypothetical protein